MEMLIKTTPFWKSLELEELSDKNRVPINQLKNEYEKESGYIRLWNKRDTGNIVNTVYDFYPNRLMIEESVRKPEDVEIESQKGLF